MLLLLLLLHIVAAVHITCTTCLLHSMQYLHTQSPPLCVLESVVSHRTWGTLDGHLPPPPPILSLSLSEAEGGNNSLPKKALSLRPP